MKILIIGEFSGFAKHLKNGFNQLGHEVSIVHTGDGFKGFKADDNDILYSLPHNITVGSFELKWSNFFFRQKKNNEIIAKLNKKGDFDIIVIICDSFITNSIFKVGVSLGYVKKQVQKGAKVILTSCGGDAAYLKYLPEEKFFDIAFPNGIPDYINSKKLCELLKFTSVIIPTAYDYYYTMNRFLDRNFCGKVSMTYVPLPITIMPVTITSCKNRKIVIFHGVIRPIRKGTPFFKEALRRIQSEFPNQVEIIIGGNMPYDKYIEVFNRMDILLDQTNGYGTGINANLGLMNGKVVFSGNEPEEENLRGYPSPVINAIPNSDDIYEKLKQLIIHPTEIDRIKNESREYALKYLDSKKIASLYFKLVGF